LRGIFLFTVRTKDGFEEQQDHGAKGVLHAKDGFAFGSPIYDL